MAKDIFMTFDDGPKAVTPEVLDVLKAANNALATFFLTGTNLSEAKQKEILPKMIAAQHSLGNHCYVHKPAKLQEYKDAYGDMTTPAQRAAFKKNLDDNLTHFRNVLNKPDFNLTLVRLPGDGRFHAPSVAEVKKLNYLHVGWDVEFAPNGTLGHITENDWQGITGVACTQKGFPADKQVVLVHDHHWAGKMPLLAALLKKLADNQFSFKKLVPPPPPVS